MLLRRCKMYLASWAYINVDTLQHFLIPLPPKQLPLSRFPPPTSVIYAIPEKELDSIPVTLWQWILAEWLHSLSLESLRESHRFHCSSTLETNKFSGVCELSRIKAFFCQIRFDSQKLNPLKNLVGLYGASRWSLAGVLQITNMAIPEREIAPTQPVLISKLSFKIL